MVDTKTPGDKTLSVPTKTLTLKPRVETGHRAPELQPWPHQAGRGRKARQAPHWRRWARDRGAARAGAGGRQGRARQGADEPVPPRRRSAAQRFGRGAAHADRGRALRARQRAGRRQGPRRRGAPAGGRGSQAPQQQGRHRAGRARGRRSPPQGRGRTPPAGRGSQAQGRTRSQEAFWRGRGQGRDRDRDRRGRAPRLPAARAPGVAADVTDEDEGPRQIRRGPGGVVRPAAPPKTTAKPAPAKAARPPDAGHRAQCRRRARALDRLVPPPHPAPEGACSRTSRRKS